FSEQSGTSSQLNIGHAESPNANIARLSTDLNNNQHGNPGNENAENRSAVVDGVTHDSPKMKQSGRVETGLGISVVPKDFINKKDEVKRELENVPSVSLSEFEPTADNLSCEVQNLSIENNSLESSIATLKPVKPAETE